MKYDLHIHTSCSDGKYDKLELLKYFNDNDYVYVAFPDHNYIEMLSIEKLNKSYYEKYKNKQLVEIIDAVEFDVIENSSMHILGYDIKDKERVKEKLDYAKRCNTEICEKIIKKIKEIYGVNIPFNALLQKKGNVAKTDITSWLVSNKYAKNYKEAGILYTSKYSPCYEKKFAFKTKEVLDLIDSSQGYSILAHPSSLGLSKSELEIELKRLISYGLNGLEINNLDKTNQNQLEFYKKLALDLNLLRTCGSDFHSEVSTNFIGLEDNESDNFVRKIKGGI